MVEHYYCIYDDLVASSQEEGSTIKITSLASMNRAKKVKAMLEEIHLVMAALQEQNLSYVMADNILMNLADKYRNTKDTRSHAFYQYKLKIEKASARLHLTPNYAFESGIIKIQSNKQDDSMQTFLEKTHPPSSHNCVRSNGKDSRTL